jgi:hypothetical protein
MSFHATTPLDPLGSEIRLLSLIPGRFKERIRCFLVKASLSSFESMGNIVLSPRSERPDGEEARAVTSLSYSVDLLWSGYYALSYAWGTATNTSITINHQRGFLVTENLAAALRRLRRTKEPRWLWIDAICIDQNNTAERSQQVAIMGEIYRRANSVLIWLGEPDVKMKKPIGLFRASLKGTKKKSLSARRNLPLFLLVETLKVVPSRWWERTWVLQEFLMASDEPMVLYGPCDLVWSNFQEMVMVGLDADLLKADFFPNPGRWAYYIERFSFLSKGDSIVDIAGISKKTKCLDPRDKVYGVLSLISKEERRYILPDYSKPCSEIYSVATYAALRTDQSCRALHLASLGLSALEGLPSWAIDFSSEEPELDLSFLYVNRPTYSDMSHNYPNGSKSSITPGLERSQAFMKRLQSSRKVNFQIDISSDARLLAVSGRMIDQVEVFIQLPISDQTKPTEERMAAVWRIYHTLHQLGEPSLDDTLAEERPVHCSEGNHNNDCVRFHASLCSRFKLRSLRSSEPAEVTDERIISLLNTLYTDFHYHAGSTSPELESNFPKPWGEAWNDHYRWLYLDLLEHRLVFFTTTTGLIGCASTEVEAGDCIVLLDYSKSPCVLRRVGDQFTFHGFVYVESPSAGDLGVYFGDHYFEEMDFVLC